MAGNPVSGKGRAASPAARAAARRERRGGYSGERLAKYLANAGAWYYDRYAPSVGRLREWLARRSNGDASAAESALAALEPLFCEAAVLDSRARDLLARGKSRRFARMALLRKKFAEADVDAALAAYAEEFSGWETYRAAAERRLKAFSGRGKTERECAAALRAAFPDFARETAVLAKAFFAGRDDSADFAAAFGKAAARHGLDSREGRAKVFQKLVYRGYAPARVRRALGETDPEGD